MFTRSKRIPNNIAAASRAALAQPQYANATLADGSRVRLRRLSWIEALGLWEEFSAALLGLLASVGAEQCSAHLTPPSSTDDASLGEGRSAAPPLLDTARAATECGATENASGTLALPDTLAALPGLALKLAAICADEDAAEMAQRDACDVLAIAATALRHNFISPSGVADFFAALAELSG